MKPLSLETRTLYAELLDRHVALRAARTIGALRGVFTEKTVKGRNYLYFQFSEPGWGHRQLYLGAQSPRLQGLVGRFRKEKAENRAEREANDQLVAQLRAGGTHVPDSSVGRVIMAFADAGAFFGDAVLIGTHAFLAIGTMLGVRWAGAASSTQDIDLAGIELAVSGKKAEVPDSIERLEMGFLPIPRLNARQPSTSFKIRGGSLRVDLLTPGKHEGGTPVYLKHLGGFAQPLVDLDYLLEERTDAVLPYGEGVLISVPDPARLAVHKLCISADRAASEQAKATKDLIQSAELIKILSGARPGDLPAAIEAAHRRGRRFFGKLKTGHAALRKIDTAAADLLQI